MAVSILLRPDGIILGSAVSATIDDNGGGGQLRIIKTSHGLTTGNKIYIQSDVDDYNGFWYVSVINSDTFLIEVYPSSGTPVSYISGSALTYYASVYNHGWSCVHLPITYKLTNTRWPTNSVDTARTIDTLNDDLGYARVTLSGSLGTFEDLSFVKISGASNSDFDGVYQILDKLSTTNITLNVAYSTFNGTGLLGATIQLYHGNYNIVVRVYAGINSSHEWTAQKPYELAATLELIPEADNTVMFSINEILKAYVETKNNLLLGTLPNNIDAWCNFYIEYAEQYDSSNGYTVSTTLSSFTSDLSTFEGTGVNAMLPFKNIHSGHLSEYLMTNNTAKFLTLFLTPVLFSCGDDVPDCYNDISFLNPANNAVLSVRRQWYLNGVLQTTDTEALGTLDSGLIRFPIDADCNYDRVDLTVLYNAPAIDDFSLYSNGDFGQVDWVLGVSTLNDVVGTASDATCLPFLYVSGVTYTITYNITLATSGAWDSSIFTASFAKTKTATTSADDATDSDTYNTNGVKAGTFTLTPTATAFGFLRFFHSIGILGTPAEGILTINSISISFTAPAISETKQIDIDCGCADQEIRLTWLNYLGGFDYWVFKTETGKAIDILSTSETTKNIFPEWPKSYGEFSDTIRKQVSRESTNRLFFTTQYLTEDQADAVAYIKTSPLVQIINSKSDRRTIIVDSDSFTKYIDNQKLITISFSARYTDNIGSQKV